jgi:hypothetical protein
MKARIGFWLALALVACVVDATVAHAQTTWMQPRVRVWYVGAAGDADMSSNAEEAYLLQSIVGTTATVKYHSALTHWTLPKPTTVGTYSTTDMGPCWIHPQRLQTVQIGEYWRGDQRITLVERDKTFNDLPNRLLPAWALQDLAPQRQVVKITYKIDKTYALPTGSAWFDAATGLLLYHNSWWGGTRYFFILAEINYDFARGVMVPEDNGPHTGFRSFVSERSLGVFMVGGGGSITIQSMVESRYGSTVQTLVLPSITPSSFSSAYRNFAFFGDVPVVRQKEYPASTNSRPEQWTAFGQHLWWWLPSTVTGAAAVAPAAALDAAVEAGAGAEVGAAAAAAINVFDVPMSRTATQPLTYTATQTPQRFHFSWLKFDAAGYMTEFAAKDPSTGLSVQPGDFTYFPCWVALQQLGRDATGPEDCVDGRKYYATNMALAPLPKPGISSLFPATGPTSGGTAITITGTNFIAGETGVTVGGAAATEVLVQSATSLTCKTPAGTLGKRDVTVTTGGGSATADGAFEYVESAVVTPAPDPAQPVTVSVPVQGGTLTATFSGVTTSGTLTVTPVTAPTPPMTQVSFLPGTAFSLSATGVAYKSVTICVPYTDAAVAAAGLTEETLMVWLQPSSSTPWVDATVSHDLGGNRVCALNALTFVTVAGMNAALPQARYLSEGATSNFFATSLALANPSATATANAVLRFARADTTTRVRYVAVPPHGRRTVDVSTVPEMDPAEFSTVIESDQPLIADRTMAWGDTGYGAHAETSVASPATTWYLAEGATHSGFSLFYLVQNPHQTEAAQVRVRYLRPSGAPLEKVHTVPPHSRYNIWVNQEELPPGSGQKPLASTDVSAVLESVNGVAVIVERAMYLDRPGQVFAAGHESAGLTRPATSWFLAEGATGGYFDLFVLLANPGTTDAQVEATYLLPSGATIAKSYEVPANSRFNIWVDFEDPQLANTAVSTTIRSTNDVPIIVERAMWWPGGNWYEAHNSAGATATGTVWALAEGKSDTARGLETYILVANTSTTAATVRVTLLFEDGTTAERTFGPSDIPAQSRFNVPVGGFFAQAAGKRFGAIVESLGETPAQIVVERAMYWDAAGQQWAAGTNALATKLQ